MRSLLLIGDYYKHPEFRQIKDLAKTAGMVCAFHAELDEL
jgi:hypothetical protein